MSFRRKAARQGSWSWGFALLGVLAVSLILFLWLVESPQEAGGHSEPPEPPETQDQKTRSGVTRESTTAAPQTPQHVELSGSQQTVAKARPPSDLPFKDQFSALLEAHRTGDTVASCRLALGVTECLQYQRSLAFTQAAERNARFRLDQGMARDEDEAFISAAANSLEFLEQRALRCDGAAVSKGPSASEIITQAAPRLSPAQKTVIAMIRSDGQLRRLNPPNRSYSQSQQYVYPQYLADHALEFLDAGFRAADPLALEGLAIVHAPGNGVPRQGVGVSLPNPRLYARYALLLQELYGPEVLGSLAQQLIEFSLASLTPNEVQEVHQWVSFERPRWAPAAASSLDGQSQRGRGRRIDVSDVDDLCQP